MSDEQHNDPSTGFVIGLALLMGSVVAWALTLVEAKAAKDPDDGVGSGASAIQISQLVDEGCLP